MRKYQAQKVETTVIALYLSQMVQDAADAEARARRQEEARHLQTVLDLQAKVKGLEDQLLERIERERALVAERAAERERTPLEGKAAENSSRRGSAPAVPLGKSNRKFEISKLQHVY